MSGEFDNLDMRNIDIKEEELNLEEFMKINADSRKKIEELESGEKDLLELFDKREIKNPKIICGQVIMPRGKELVAIAYECPGCGLYYDIPPKVDTKGNPIRPSFYYHCRSCNRDLGYLKN